MEIVHSYFLFYDNDFSIPKLFALSLKAQGNRESFEISFLFFNKTEHFIPYRQKIEKLYNHNV